MKVKITTLSPIHIGSGKEISPIEFINNYRISFDRLCDLIYEKFGEKFFDFLNEEENLENLDAQKLIRKFNLNNNEVVKYCGIYRLNSILRRSTREALKVNHKLYIPGTSLQGSIRTALLYKVLKDDPIFLSNYLNNLLTKLKEMSFHKFESLMKSLDDKLIQRVFHYGKKNSNGFISYEDQQNDLMKLLYVSDSNSIEVEEHCSVDEIKVFAFNKDLPHLGFSIYAETIVPKTTFEFELRFNLDFVKEIAKKYKSQKKFIEDNFVDIDKKLLALFNIDIFKVDELDETSIIKNILDDLLNFGQEVSKVEAKYVNSLKNKTNFKFLSHIYDFDSKFKIGYGSGFHAMTIFPLLYTDRFRDMAQTLYQTLSIGRHRNKAPLNINQFPFTRKLKYNDRIEPLGWVTFSEYAEKFFTGEVQANVSTAPVTTTNKNNLQIKKDSILAEIIDDKSKPPKVKILEGDNEGKETILPGIKLDGLGLSVGSKVYVKLHFDKKNLQKAEFKGKAE